jgi:RNA polymerase sigma-70 factor (ECF subfamily)
LKKRADKEEFVRLVDDHRNLIHKVCRSFCPDPDDRKDLEQEILIRLWQGLPRFDGRVKISTWLYRVALNTAISFHRAEKKRGRKLPVETVFCLAEEPEDTRSGDVERLYGLIEKLGELDKALILLYLDNIPQADISTILGITPTNVATKVGRVKKQLKEKFKPS